MIMNVNIDARKATKLHKSLLIQPFLYNIKHKEIDLRDITIEFHSVFTELNSSYYTIKLNYLHLIGANLSTNRLGNIELYDLA